MSVRRRLRRFRERHGLSLREAARQLHVTHQAIMAWESGVQVPSVPYRNALEVWTRGEIAAADWPLSPNRRALAAQAGRVGPVVPAVVDESAA